MASQETYDLLMKLIVIGDSGTGKSCILHRFIEKKFVEDQTHTIGVEFGARVVDLLGKKVKLQIWDTAGQERYRSVTRTYYRSAAGCLLVYDITNRESFDACARWLQDARTLAGQDLVVMLVGNKADMGNTDQRQVTHIEASQYAQSQGLMHFETSAVTGEYIEEAFIKVAKTTVMRVIQEEKLVSRGANQEDGDAVALLEGDRAEKKRCAC